MLCVVIVTMSALKRVVFLGTPPVAARSLELLHEASRAGRGAFELAGVVSQPPARTGRKKLLTPSPVHALAEEIGLPLFTPPNAKDEDFLTALEEMQPDLCITAAYGCFLPRRFLDIPAHGTLNIHPSLLPKYRGAAPLQRCLEAGDAVGGVSVLFTVLKMDAGPVLRQEERPLSGDEQAPELLLELFERGTELLVDALPSVWDGSSSAAATAQDGDAATPAPKVDITEAELRLAEIGARDAHNRVRAFAGWPGTWCPLRIGDGDAVRAKLGRTRVGDPSSAAAAGTVALSSDGKALELSCGDGSVLEVLELTLPGKKPVGPKAFWNGLNGRDVAWVEA